MTLAMDITDQPCEKCSVHQIEKLRFAAKADLSCQVLNDDYCSIFFSMLDCGVVYRQSHLVIENCTRPACISCKALVNLGRNRCWRNAVCSLRWPGGKGITGGSWYSRLPINFGCLCVGTSIFSKAAKAMKPPPLIWTGYVWQNCRESGHKDDDLKCRKRLVRDLNHLKAVCRVCRDSYEYFSGINVSSNAASHC